MSKFLIQFDQVCFSYNETHVLKKVSFEIQAGEFIAIVGPNGGGKTTLLKLIMGLLKPLSGKINSPNRTRIGYVPQIAQFDPAFPIRVKEVVMMGGYAKLNFWGSYPPEMKKACQEILKQVNMEGKEDELFGALSGGQKQRVLIARALFHDPELLLLDEPTANIDQETEAVIFDMLRERKKKSTILMVTHHLESVIGEVDRVFCVQQELSAFPPKEVCKHFAYGSYHKPLLAGEECPHDS